MTNKGNRLMELRRSNAAGAHKHKATKRNRDKSSQKRNAIADQQS